MPAAFPSLCKGEIALDDFLLNSLKTHWRDYRKEFKRCKKKFSETAVHDVRIAIRRLLATLGLLDSVLPPNHVHLAGRALKKRLNLFARLRDTHAQLLYVEQLRRAFPAARSYHHALGRRERRLIKRVCRRLPRAKDERLAESISSLNVQIRALAGDHSHAAERFTAVLTAVRAAFAEVTKRRRAIRPADTSTIHRTRVAFKQFRYMTEALQPFLPGVTRKMLEAMRDYQASMGDIQDIEVLLASVDKFVAKHGGKPPQWAELRAELRRRRASLVRQFIASADELESFTPQIPTSAHSRRPVRKPKP